MYFWFQFRGSEFTYGHSLEIRAYYALLVHSRSARLPLQLHLEQSSHRMILCIINSSRGDKLSERVKKSRKKKKKMGPSWGLNPGPSEY